LYTKTEFDNDIETKKKEMNKLEEEIDELLKKRCIYREEHCKYSENGFCNYDPNDLDSETECYWCNWYEEKK